MSDFGISSASGVHELAKKGVRAIGYDGRALSSATIQPDRAPNSRGQAHESVGMGDGAVAKGDAQPLPGWIVETYRHTMCLERMAPRADAHRASSLAKELIQARILSGRVRRKGGLQKRQPSWRAGAFHQKSHPGDRCGGSPDELVRHLRS